VPGAYQSVGFAGVADGVFANGSGISSVQTWVYARAFTHNWESILETASTVPTAQLSMQWRIRYHLRAVAALGAAVVGVSPTATRTLNVAQAVCYPLDAGEELTFSAEFTYTNLDQKLAGVVAVPAGRNCLPTGSSVRAEGSDTVSLLLPR